MNLPRAYTRYQPIHVAAHHESPSVSCIYMLSGKRCSSLPPTFLPPGARNAVGCKSHSGQFSPLHYDFERVTYRIGSRAYVEQ